MKKRIVLWGSCANDEKCLVALELRDKDNKVDLYTFSESLATETFYNQMMNIWREGNELTFPEGFIKIERDLAITEDLLPDDIKVDRPDVIVRAKAEWHFVVLSSKLYEIYNSELEDMKERVDQLKEFDDAIWEEMKTFWAKVQEQTIEKNIFREHANSLKEKTNKIFERLKDLKKILDQRFREESRERANEFKKKLDAIEQKIEQGLGLKPIFEELKKMQSEFHGTSFTRKDRRKTWEYLDGLFKKVKEKRFGDKKGGKSTGDRVSRRYDGLVSAIGKMEKSIQRDRQEQDFQNKRISQTDGQLEMQIRQAKIKMIDERIRSKAEKLEDMYKTKVDLEARMAKIKEKEEQKKEEEKIREVKQEIKDKIEETVAEKSAKADSDEDLKKAAEEINKAKKGKPKKESLMGAIAETMGESLEDVVDTVKAVADVVGDKIEEVTEDIKEKMSDTKSKEENIPKSDEKATSESSGPEEGEKDDSIMESISEVVSDSLEGVAEKIKDVVGKVGDKIDEALEEIKADEEE